MPITWKNVGSEFGGLGVNPTYALGAAGQSLEQSRSTFQDIADRLKK
jgi:hypothetical protein